MPKAGRRSITLFDIMVLIAATALGLAIARVGWPPRVASSSLSYGGGLTISYTPVSAPSGYRSRMTLVPVVRWIAPWFSILAAWSVALMACRSRHPRPRWRRLAGQPGFVASVAVVAVWVVETPLMLGLSWFDGRFGWSSPTRLAGVAANFTVLLGHHAGLAVAIAWVVLALGGRWRAEPGWIDRSGRLLGLAWILAGTLCTVLVDQATWWGDFLNP